MKSERVINVCIVIIVAIFGSKMVNAEYKKIDHQIELVLVLDDSYSVNEAEFALLLNATRNFPNYFVMDERSTRMAVVMFAVESWIEVNLTADSMPIRNVNPTRTRAGSTNTHLGLNNAKDKVFDKARNGALKIVVLITDGESSNMSAAEDAAKELRDQQAHVFVIFVGTEYKDKEHVRKHVDTVAGGVDNVVPIDGYDELPEKIRGLIKKLACTWYDGCRFDPDGGCVADTFRLEEEDCERGIKPTPSPNYLCPPDRCNATCDRWQWEKIECRPGESEVQVKRVGDGEGTKRMFEYCPKEKTVSCPPATDASGNPITFSSTRTTTDVSGIIFTDESGRPVTETGEPDKSSTGSSSEPGGGVTAITQGANEGQAANDTEGGLEAWHIAVIVVAVVLVLLIVIVAVLITARRRRRQAVASKKDVLIKKKVAIEAAKSVSSTSDGSKSGGARGRALAFGYGKGGADTSVEVSLAEINTRRSKKPVAIEVKSNETAAAVACKIKKKGFGKGADSSNKSIDDESKSKSKSGDMKTAMSGKSKSIVAKKS